MKFQSAYYEALGSEGVAVLKNMIKRAREAGLLTILDAKRGDISSTMKAYGLMAFEYMNADALTVTPYMGLDVTDALLPWLKEGRGVYVVWVSSNPGGSLLQDMETANGDTLASRLLDALVNSFQKNGVPEALGLVLGATKADQLSGDLFAKLQSVPLLMPGVGAQGGSVSTRTLALARESHQILVPQSRSLSTFDSPFAPIKNWSDYRRLLEDRLPAAVADLAEQV